MATRTEIEDLQRPSRAATTRSGGLTALVPLELGTAIAAEFDGLGSVEVYCRSGST